MTRWINMMAMLRKQGEASDILSSLCHILAALRPLWGWLWWGHIQDNKHGDVHALIIAGCCRQLDWGEGWVSPDVWSDRKRWDRCKKNGFHWSVNMSHVRREQLVTPKVEVKSKHFVCFTIPAPDLVSMLTKKIVYILLFINLTSGGKVKIILSRIQVFCLSTFKTHH